MASRVLDQVASPVALKLVQGAARALYVDGHETGATIRGAERLSELLGPAVSLIPSWDGILFLGTSARGEHEAPVRVTAGSPTSIAMNRVVAVNYIIEDVIEGRLEPSAAEDAVQRAATAPPSNVFLFATACATGASALALIFGAKHWQAIILVAVSGALGGFLRRFLGAHGLGTVAQAIAAALLAGSVGALAVHLHVSSELRLVAVCACMILVPGPHILNGALDLAALRLSLGVARLTFASLILIGISAGLIIGLQFGGTTLPASSLGRDVPLWIDVPAAGVAVASYSVFYSMPLRMLGWPIAVGMVAHGTKWWVTTALGWNAAESAGIACLIVGAIMVPISERRRLPFAGVGFACVVSLIPGLFVFRMVSGLMQSGATPTVLPAVFTDAMTAMLIVVSMAIGLVIPSRVYEFFRLRAQRKSKT